MADPFLATETFGAPERGAAVTKVGGSAKTGRLTAPQVRPGLPPLLLRSLQKAEPWIRPPFLTWMLSALTA